MKSIWLGLAISSALLVGCSSRDDATGNQPAAAIRVLLPEATTGAVRLWVVEAPAVARVLQELAARMEVADALPAEAYGSFAAVATTPPVTATADEVVNVPTLLPRQLVVVTDDREIWVNTAGDLRNGRLVMGEGQRGGQVALRAALGLPGVRDELARVARTAMDEQQFERARRLARILNDAALLADLRAAEVDQLIARARGALARDDVDQALAFVASADDILPGNDASTAVRQLILEEYGGLQRVLTDHAGAVHAVGVNREGTMLATAGDDKVIRLWDVARGSLARILEGHQARVTGLTFDPTGRMLASCSHDGTVRLWEVATGEPRFASPNLGWKEAAIAFSPDGRWIASGGDDAQVRVWTVSAMWDRRYFRGHGWGITSLVFGPDARQLISGSADDTATQWNVTTGENVRTFRKGFSDVLSVAVDPSGHWVATGAADGAVRLWSPDDKEEPRAWSVSENAVRAIGFTPSGKNLVAGVGELIAVWEVASGELARLFRSQHGVVNALAVLPDGRRLVAGTEGGQVVIWRFPKKIWPIEAK